METTVIENTGQLKEHSIPMLLGWYFLNGYEWEGPFATEEEAQESEREFHKDE